MTQDRSYLALLLIVAVVTLTFTGCFEPALKTYSPPDGSFSMLFPGQPQKETMNGPLGITIVGYVSEFSSEKGVLLQTANFSTLVEMAGRENISGVIENNIRQIKDGANVEEITEPTEIELDGKHPGRAVTMTFVGGKVFSRARVYLVENQWYMQQVYGPREWVESAEGTKILDSFKVK